MQKLIDEECSKPQAESIRERIEDIFLDSISKLIAGSIGISWKDRDIFINLIRNCIGSNFNSMLKEYLNYHFSVAGESLIRELDLPKDIKINPQYATHAKLSDHIEAIKKKMEDLLKVAVAVDETGNSYDNPKELVNSIEKNLLKCNVKDLKEIVKQANEWFDVDTNYCKVIKTKKEMVKWIMGFDPVFMKGGLLSFINEMKLKGLYNG